jgi:hypothetical protein
MADAAASTTAKELEIVYEATFQAWIDSKTFDAAFPESEWLKLEQAAQVHQYRGASKARHNGIVPIRPTDKGLFKTLGRLVKASGVDASAIKDALPVKAVAHVTSGNRLVGYMYPALHKVVFYGVANYSD